MWDIVERCEKYVDFACYIIRYSNMLKCRGLLLHVNLLAPQHQKYFQTVDLSIAIAVIVCEINGLSSQMGCEVIEDTGCSKEMCYLAINCQYSPPEGNCRNSSFCLLYG